MEIKQQISPWYFIDRKGSSIDKIVMHDVGALSTAKNNADYYNKERPTRIASVHFFVDDNEIIQVGELDLGAQHCSNYAMHKRSIAIEMCLMPDAETVTDQTEANAIWLVKQLMAQFGLGHSDVIRHYDVTGKLCPGQFQDDDWARWWNFKSKLTQQEEQPMIKWTDAELQDGRYMLLSAQSGKALDLDVANNRVIIYRAHGKPNQLWDKRGNVWTNVATGKVLDIAGGSQDDGAALIVWDAHGGANQEFIYTKEGFLVNPNSLKAIDVWGASTDDCTTVNQYRLHGNPNQMWYAVRVAE